MGRAERATVRAELTPNLSEAGRQLVATVVETIPAYRSLDPAQLAEVSAIAAWTFGLVLDSWVQDTPLEPRDLHRFRGIGAARAADGRPLAAVLRAYRVATGTATELIMEHGRDRLEIEDVLDLTRLWTVVLDELSEALFTSYTATSARLSGDRDRAVQALFDDLVAGRRTSHGALADRCHQLGVTLPTSPALLLAQPLDPASAATAADAGSLFAGLAGPVLVTTRGRRAVLLTPPPSRAALAAALDGRGWCGCLNENSQIDELPAAHRLAADALDAAPPHAYRVNRLLTDGDAHTLALLNARPTAHPPSVVRAVLGSLTEPRHEHLIDGLGAFLATGSATEAARSLHLHPQTLRYRLRRVRELTGRDPRDPWDRLVLDIARHLAVIPTG
ncbi:PucR family transcriptional regulator [Amycolatopsis nigrescens]|uniref:PucR family transcriptional regulator n=1 Tax=Amycolatopsis nigrescens TaxID=381445 RepID=UPI0003822B91|nr:helix-turn-helix domain-containing protein [Amycolatopsis nigrescens]